MSQIGAAFVLLVLPSTFADNSFSPFNTRFGLFRGLSVLHATSHSLRMMAVCDNNHCREEPKWTLKDIASGLPPTNNSTAVGEVVTFDHLAPDTTYAVTVIIGDKTAQATVVTCSRELSEVRDLRVVSSGLGWLEVRWSAPLENCRSQLTYFVAYGPISSPQSLVPTGHFFSSNPLGANLTGISLEPIFPTGRMSRSPKSSETHENELPPPKEVKMIRDRGGALRPVYPCPTWPKDFCVWLTDNVEPFRLHSIVVRARRVDGAPFEESPAAEVQASARGHVAPRKNPLFGWSVPGLLWQTPGAAGDRGAGYCAMWSGVAIGTGVTTLLAALAMVLITMHRKKKFYAARKAYMLATAAANASDGTASCPDVTSDIATDSQENTTASRQPDANESSRAEGESSTGGNIGSIVPANTTAISSTNREDSGKKSTKAGVVGDVPNISSSVADSEQCDTRLADDSVNQ